MTEEQIEKWKEIITHCLDKTYGKQHDFVTSLDEFLEERGFLTQRQQESLLDIFHKESYGQTY